MNNIVTVDLTRTVAIVEVFTHYVMVTIANFKSDDRVPNRMNETPIFYQTDYLFSLNPPTEFKNALLKTNNRFSWLVYANLGAKHITDVNLKWIW